MLQTSLHTHYLRFVIWQCCRYYSPVAVNVSLKLQTFYRPKRCFDAGRSEDQIPMGTRFCALVQNGPEAHPASYTVNTGSFPREVGRCMAWTTQPHLAPRLKKEYGYTSAPLCAFMAGYMETLSFYSYFD